jgi:hypothetical protein
MHESILYRSKLAVPRDESIVFFHYRLIAAHIGNVAGVRSRLLKRSRLPCRGRRFDEFQGARTCKIPILHRTEASGWLPRIAHSPPGGPLRQSFTITLLVGLAFRIGAETFTKPTRQGDRLENAR